MYTPNYRVRTKHHSFEYLKDMFRLAAAHNGTSELAEYLANDVDIQVITATELTVDSPTHFVGYVAYKRRYDDNFSPLVHIVDIIVDEDYRNQGNGRYALQKVIDDCCTVNANPPQAHEFVTFILTVSIENEPAINLYKKLGFKQSSYNYDYYGFGHDAITMSMQCLQCVYESTLNTNGVS